MKMKKFVLLLALLAIPMGLILIEPDNGTVAIIFSALVVLFVLTKSSFLVLGPSSMRPRLVRRDRRFEDAARRRTGSKSTCTPSWICAAKDINPTSPRSRRDREGSSAGDLGKASKNSTIFLKPEVTISRRFLAKNLGFSAQAV